MSEQDKTSLDDTELEVLFEARRGAPAAPPEPDPAFLAAVLRAAEDVQAGFAPPSRGAARRAFWPVLREALGGWTGMGGLAAATLASVWIGMSVTLTMPGELAVLLGGEAALVDPVAGFDFVWDEG